MERTHSERPTLRTMHSIIQEESIDDEEIEAPPPKELIQTHSLSRRKLSTPNYMPAAFMRKLSPIPASPIAVSPRSSNESQISTAFGFHNQAFSHAISESKLQDYKMMSILSLRRSRFGDKVKYIEQSTMHTWTGAKRTENTSKWGAEREAAFCRELEDLAALDHPRVAKLKAYFIGKNEIYVFRDYSPVGTLEDEIKRDGPLCNNRVLDITKQILQGLQYCHKRESRILHRNLKTSNILLQTDKNIRLCDFGLENLDLEINPHSSLPRRSSDSTRVYSHARRTILSAAPEIIQRLDDPSAYTESCDIWALGCVIIEMLTTKPLFADLFNNIQDDELQNHLIRLTNEGKIDYTMKHVFPDGKDSENLNGILQEIFNVDEQSRISATELLLLEALNYDAEIVIPIPTQTKRSLNSKIPKLIIPKPELLSQQTETEQLLKNKLSHTLIEIEKKESLEDSAETVHYCFRWYGNRCMLFITLLLKWMFVVFLSALSLGFSAYLVFTAIFLIYKAIGIICQCNLNEGFIVLIALILLPILILLTTLCCNNSIEKYKQAKLDGSLEKCAYVKKTPKDDIVLCGILLVKGKLSDALQEQLEEEQIRRKNADNTQPEATVISQALRIQSGFAMGVSKLA